MSVYVGMLPCEYQRTTLQLVLSTIVQVLGSNAASHNSTSGALTFVAMGVILVSGYFSWFQYLTEVIINKIKITFCCFDFFSLISSRAGVQKAITYG